VEIPATTTSQPEGAGYEIDSHTIARATLICPTSIP
jgi:hypothetical protein